MLSDTQHYGWYDTASDSSSHWIMKITIRNFFLQYPQTHIHIKHIHMYSCTHTGTYTYANDQTWHSSVTFNCLKTACPMMLLAQYSSGAYLSTELSTHVELLLFSSSNVMLSFRKTSQLPIAFSVTLFVVFPFVIAHPSFRSWHGFFCYDKPSPTPTLAMCCSPGMDCCIVHALV